MYDPSNLDLVRFWGTIIGLPSIFTILAILVRLTWQISAWQSRATEGHKYMQEQIERFDANLNGVHTRIDSHLESHNHEADG